MKNNQVKLTAIIDRPTRRRLITLKERLMEEGHKAHTVSPGKLIILLLERESLAEQLQFFKERL